jgi:hypothetical protein
MRRGIYDAVRLRRMLRQPQRGAQMAHLLLGAGGALYGCVALCLRTRQLSLAIQIL